MQKMYVKGKHLNNTLEGKEDEKRCNFSNREVTGANKKI